MERSNAVQFAIDHLVATILEERQVADGDDTGLTFGELIRRERQRMGITLTELGSRIGASPSHLGEMEHGRAVNPNVDMLAALAGGLGLRPVHLLSAAIKSQRQRVPRL